MVKKRRCDYISQILLKCAQMWGFHMKGQTVVEPRSDPIFTCACLIHLLKTFITARSHLAQQITTLVSDAGSRNSRF